METKTYDQIYRSMRAHIAAAQDRLTDFNDGSVLMSLVEAQAREFAMLYINCKAGFLEHLRGLPFSAFSFAMKEGSPAGVEVVFTRALALDRRTRIPAGAEVSGGGAEFVTTEAAVIAAGETASPPVTAVSKETGVKNNVPALAVKTVKSGAPAEVAAAVNPKAAAGGEDGEDWAAYLDRFSKHITGLGGTNKNGYIAAITAAGAASVGLEEHFPPLDGLWNVTVYAEDGSGGISPDGLAKAAAAGDKAKPPGVNIRYLPPEKLSADIRVKAVLRAANDVPQAAARALEAAALNYASGLKIGGAFILSDLIAALRAAGVTQSVIIESPRADLRPGIAQIARLGSFVAEFEGAR